MTDQIVTTAARAVNFNRSDLYAAAAEARRKVAGNQTMLRAVERALVNLSGGQFSYTGDHVVLASATSSERYTISTTEPMVCNCKGRARGYTCWHIVAARLIQRAAERHAAALVAPSAPRYTLAQIEARAAELFA